MKIFNTQTRTIEEFVPNEAGRVKMYTCGPTVYHFAHIGNLRSYIEEDVLEKYLRKHYEVTRVMNITDVGHLSSDADTGEDKMLKGAKREKKSVMEIAKFYTDAFFSDCRELNIKKPDIVVPATKSIGSIIKMITGLIDGGYAYLAGGNVYFDTSRLDNYYVLSNNEAEDLEVGVREGVDEDSNKRNKTDFVLWFTKSKFEDQELKWNSPWGLGYPGWHIECSAICISNLGERVDIHCGGVDNIFPHHTNEIAQSEAYLGHKWCNYWFHVHHLNTPTGKMSKSSGEFLTVSLLKEKGYDPMVYRFFCLLSHYRKSLAFSYEALDNAKAAYEKLISKIASLEKGSCEADREKVSILTAPFYKAMDNDLNTSLAITAIYDVLKSSASDADKLSAIAEIDDVLSLNLLKAAEEKRNSKETSIDSDFAEWIGKMISERAQAKINKDFARADSIREMLSEKGVMLTDTREGTTYTVVEK